MKTKYCTKCKTSKPMTTEFFGKHNRTKDGFRNECKECRNQRLVHHWNSDKTLLKCIQCDSYKDPYLFDKNDNAPHRNYKDRRCKQCKRETAKKRRTSRSRTDQFHRIFVERFQGMRDRSKKHNIEFNISVEDLKDIFDNQNGKCALSGIKMTAILGSGRVPTNISVDQIEAKKGYTIDNVQLVCMAVNQMKSDLSYDDLLMFCEAISRNARKWNK